MAREATQHNGAGLGDVRILKETHQVRLGALLQCQKGFALKA